MQPFGAFLAGSAGPHKTPLGKGTACEVIRTMVWMEVLYQEWAWLERGIEASDQQARA